MASRIFATPAVLMSKIIHLYLRQPSFLTLPPPQLTTARVRRHADCVRISSTPPHPSASLTFSTCGSPPSPRTSTTTPSTPSSLSSSKPPSSLASPCFWTASPTQFASSSRLLTLQLKALRMKGQVLTNASTSGVVTEAPKVAAGRRRALIDPADFQRMDSARRPAIAVVGCPLSLNE